MNEWMNEYQSLFRCNFEIIVQKSSSLELFRPITVNFIFEKANKPFVL